MSKIFILTEFDFNSILRTIGELRKDFGKVQRVFTDYEINLEEEIIKSNSFEDFVKKCYMNPQKTRMTDDKGNTVVEVEAIMQEDILFVEFNSGESTSLICLIKATAILNIPKEFKKLRTYKEFIKTADVFAKYIYEVYPDDDLLKEKTQGLIYTRYACEGE